MNPVVYFFACVVPMAIFLVAIVLRMVAEAQPETAWSGPRRKSVVFTSNVIIAVGFFSLVLTFIIAPLLGATLSMVFVLAVIQLQWVETRFAAQRRIAQQAELLWLLATTVRNGGNPADQLEAYASGSWGERHQRLFELADRLRQGATATEFAVPQGLLSDTAAREIQAGLRTGRLYEALHVSAMRRTRDMATETMASKVQMAIAYPASIVTVATLIIGFLMYFIVPKFKKIFDDFGTELPSITKALIGMSDVMVNYWYLLLPLFYLAVASGFLLEYAKFYGWRATVRRFFGRLFVRLHTPDLLRSLSHYVAAVCPLPAAIAGIAATSDHPALRLRLNRVHTALSQGHPCWQQLREFRFLRANEVALLLSAESVGNLPWTLNVLADAIERRWLFRLRAVIEIFGPILFLLIGAIVAITVIGFFMPLIKLLNDLS